MHQLMETQNEGKGKEGGRCVGRCGFVKSAPVLDR